MRHPIATLREEYFISSDLPFYVNRAEEDFTSLLHNHDFIEINYVAEGAGFHYIGGELHRVRKGDLYVIPIGVPHVYRPTAANRVKHPLAVYNCILSPRLLDTLDLRVTERRLAAFIRSMQAGKPLHYAMQARAETLDRLYLAMYHEFSALEQDSADYLHALLIQLLVLIYRAQPQSSGPFAHAYDATAPRPQPPEFRSILHELDLQLHDSVTLAQLAQTSGYSERHLSRLFKHHTGQSFHRYRQSRRMEQACALLKHSAMRIRDIADKVGYKDSDTFATVFKRTVGLAPSEYRKREWESQRK